jgi:hypothetical protein
MSESILVHLASRGIDINKLEKEANKYYRPLIEIIKQSPINCLNINESWEYKSIAQFATERFSDSTINRLHYAETNELLNSAVRSFSDELIKLIFYHHEGLRLFVKDADGYRLAINKDENYAYVVRLSKEGTFYENEYVEPPDWAKNLYLNSRALEVYNWFYHTSFESSKWDLMKKVKADAIANILDNDNRIEKNNLISNKVFRKDLCSVQQVCFVLAKEQNITIHEAADIVISHFTYNDKKTPLFNGRAFNALVELYDDEKRSDELYELFNAGFPRDKLLNHYERNRLLMLKTDATRIFDLKMIDEVIEVEQLEFTPSIEKPLNSRTENNYLRLIFALAGNIEGFNYNKPYESAKLIIDATEISLSQQTIADYISKAHALNSKEKD